jgi:hypothetical protein
MFSATPAAWPWGALAACRVANDGGSRCSDAASQRLFSRRRHSRATIHHQRAREQALFARVSKFATRLRVHEWACRACRGALRCYRTAYSHFGSSSRCERCTRDPHTMWSPHVVRVLACGPAGMRLASAMSRPTLLETPCDESMTRVCMLLLQRELLQRREEC